MERVRLVGGLVASSLLFGGAAAVRLTREPVTHVRVAAAVEHPDFETDDFAWVIEHGDHAYVVLGDAPEDIVRTVGRDALAANDEEDHAVRAATDGEGGTGPEASDLAEPELVPLSGRPWQGNTRFVVDGDCVATVDGYALHYKSSLLLGRLSGCHGATARAVSRPLSQTALAAAAPQRLVDAAIADALDTEAGTHARAAWAAAEHTPFVPVTTRVVLHPRTLETWIVVHAARVEDDCQDPNGFTLTAAYRVDGDDLARTSVATTTLDPDAPMLDIDDDGRFEVVDGDHLLTLGGEVIATSPAYVSPGCGC